MDITNQQALPVAQALAWEALNDIAMLQAAIPGCESITPTAPDHYDLTITAAIGPVKAKFKGKLQLADKQPPSSYSIHFEGQGGAAGHGKGHATVRLEPTGPHETVLHYTAHATVGGKIAQLGSRLVDMAAQKMAGDFFANFNAALVAKYPPPAAPEPGGTEVAVSAAAPGVGLWSRLVAWWRGLFG